MTKPWEHMELLKRVNIYRTGPIEDPQPYTLMLCSTREHLCLFRERFREGPAALIIPHGLFYDQVAPSVIMLPSDRPVYSFVQFHNQLVLENGGCPPNDIPEDCEIHDGAVIGAPGMRYVSNPETGEWLEMFHTGNIQIGHDCRIGPNSVIHRAVFGSTVIGDGTKIGALCSIGHGATLGRNCLLTAGVHIAGSAHLGDRVILGLGAVVKHGISVCSDVMVGAGAVIVKDIVESGTYAGIPAVKTGREREVW